MRRNLSAIWMVAQREFTDQFRDWLENDLWPEAAAAGIARPTFDAAFAGARPNLDLPDLVVPGSRQETR